MQKNDKLAGGVRGSLSTSQSKRIHSLSKQARDALLLLSEESLNLDMESGAALATASQAVAAFMSIVGNQTVMKIA